MRVGWTRAAGTRRAGLGCGAAFGVGAVVFLCVTLLSAAVFALSPGRSSSAVISFIPRQTGAVPWNERDRFNMLLMGSTTSGGPDVFVVLSFDPSSHRVTLLSLPSNLWITIPGTGQSRLSQVPVGANGHLALLTVQSITHAPIPYFAWFSSRAMARVIDSLGGVSVVSEGNAGRVPAHAMNHMDGAATRSYLAGSGSSGAQERERMRRSQQVVLAAAQSATQPSIEFQIPTIVNTLGGSVNTNFPYDEVPALMHALMTVPRSHIRTDRLDYSNGTVSDYSGDGGHVLMPDWQHIRVVAQRDLGQIVTSPVPVQVVNAGVIAGQASKLALWLKQSGVFVSESVTASSSADSHTHVLLPGHASSAAGSVARVIASLLQIPVLIDGSGHVPAVRVVIGRDFLDPTQQ